MPDDPQPRPEHTPATRMLFAMLLAVLLAVPLFAAAVMYLTRRIDWARRG